VDSRRCAAKLLSKDEARTNIAKLPELLSRRQRGSIDEARRLATNIAKLPVLMDQNKKIAPSTSLGAF
jgi:hypothetical protein